MTRTRWPCPCCGYLTLREEPPDTFAICPVCFWEDSGLQLQDPDYSGGANAVSLNEARANFRLFGSSEERFENDVRPPAPDEHPSSPRPSRNTLSTRAYAR